MDKISLRANEIQENFKKYIEEHKVNEIQQNVFETTDEIHSKNDIKTDKAAKYNCNICSKSFTSLSKVKLHVESHGQKGRFVCDVCGQAYKQERAFNVHMGMHNGVNPFTCQFCNKSFTQKISLVRHLPLHTGKNCWK